MPEYAFFLLSLKTRVVHFSDYIGAHQILVM
jgi:hypothetical protein